MMTEADSTVRAPANSRPGVRLNQDDYIIRIYRRDREDPRMVVGTVEQVGEKLKIGFTDFEELRAILGVPRGKTPRSEQFTDQTSSMAVASDGRG
jgi:hypothetical protein